MEKSDQKLRFQQWKKGVLYDKSWFYNKDGRKIYLPRFLPPNSEVPIKGIVLFLHGITGHTMQYSHLFKHLTRDGFIVFGLDFVGHGLSEGRKRNHIDSFQSLVDDVHMSLAFIRSEYQQPLFVFGHSLGAGVALASLPFAENLAGLILSAPPLSYYSINTGLILTFSLFGYLFPSKGIYRLSPSRLVSSSFAINELKHDVLSQNKTVTARSGVEILKQQEKMRCASLKCKCPVLMLHGDKDKVMPVSNSYKFFEQIPLSHKNKLHIIPGGDHDELYQDVEGVKVYPILLEWLKQIVG